MRDTIAKGVGNGQLAYVGKCKKGYEPFLYAKGISAADVEVSDQMFIVTKDVAEKYLKATIKPLVEPHPPVGGPPPGPTPPIEPPVGTQKEPPPNPGTTIHSITWTGGVPSQKWMNFYTKVLARFATGCDLKISLRVEASCADGIPEQKVEETKVALRELGLGDDVNRGQLTLRSRMSIITWRSKIAVFSTS